MTLDRECREDNKKVAVWLLWYPERKMECEQRRDSILYASPGPPDGMPRGTEVSDPTGRKGQKLGDLQTDEQWICLVEEVERRLPWKMQILLRLKRQYRIGARGKPVRLWIALDYSEEVSRRINKDYSVGIEQIDKSWGRVVEYAARLAAKKGLL